MQPSSESREAHFPRKEPDEDAWVMDSEPIGPVCPFGHPWNANAEIERLRRENERLLRIEEAARKIASAPDRSDNLDEKLIAQRALNSPSAPEPTDA